MTNAVQLHGKALSFNNINDTNGALELSKEYDEPTVVACKHANPCGVGSADTIYDAYMKAYTSDPNLFWRHHCCKPRDRCEDSRRNQ